MNSKLTRWAAAAVLSIGAASPALGGSVTRPGDTIGLTVGTPMPEGVYFMDNPVRQCRDTSPHRTCVNVNVPVFTWSTPWTIFDARLQLHAGPTVLVNANIEDTLNTTGLFNPFFAAQLAWDLGGGWGFSYMLGTYPEVGTSVAYSSTSLNQRFGLSYTDNGWNLSANVIWGTHFDHVTDEPQASPCPFSAGLPPRGCNPDFLNVDLTATKMFNRWELGPVALYSTDLNKPVPSYEKQSQFAVGGLVGYHFDRATLQAFVTSNVYEENYGGSQTAVSLRLLMPLWNPPPPDIAQ